MLRVPGSATDLLSVQGAGRRRAHGLLAARRGEARAQATRSGRWCSSPSASRPPRRPTRWRSGRPRELGLDELLDAGLARARAAGDGGASSARPHNRVQGFLAAGHVCTVMGYWEYEPIAAQLPRADRGHRLRAARPAARASTWRCRQLEEGRAGVENQYARAVTREGNLPGAGADRARCSRSCDRAWRGIGAIPRSGFRLRAELRRASTPSGASTSAGIARAGVAAVHRRADPAGPEEAARVPGVRHALHAGAPARRADGVDARAPAPRTTSTGGMTA